MKESLPRVAPKAQEYVAEVLGRGFLNSSAQMTTRLEKAFAERFGVRYAIAHANGTVTLQSALLAAGVGVGDEVIVPPLTAAATGLAVIHANAVPIFADIDPETFTVDVDDIRRRITPRTKAIIPVAIYGLAPDLDPIMELAREHDLTVIEDDAQCFLGYYQGRLVGSIGHFASFSFQASKHLTCGDGGILITDDADLAAKARSVASFGYATAGADAGAIMPEEARCAPDAARHATLGYNFRLPEVAAAVALAELERLEDLIAMRTESARFLDDVVRDCDWLVPQATPEGYVHSWWTYVCRITDDGPDWTALRRKFVELGGDGFYGAWRPTYREPVFETLSKEVVEKPERYPHFAGVMPDYRELHLPVIERVQPRLIQLKTNYWDLENARRQAEALRKTIQSF